MICSDKELLKMCVSQAKNHLLQITRISYKSSVNESKSTESLFSKVQDCQQGFTFLGFQIIQIKQRGLCVCTVTPSRESVRELLLLITNKIKQSRSVSIDVWINRLNPLLLRWVEYYKHCEYKRSYNQISYLIWEKTRTWLARRKRKKT